MSRLLRSYREWCITPRGREIIFCGICTAGFGAILAHLLPHTLMLDKYQEFIQMYQLGTPVPVPQKVNALMETVMDDMGISERERKFIKAFTVFGFDMFNAGSTSTKFGAIIGIPSNFAYTSTDDIAKSQIVINLKQVNWNSYAGKKLAETMVLSEEAQKFAIGREISHARSAHVFLNSIFPASATAFVYGFSKNVNDKFGLLQRHMSVRAVFYSLIGFFGFGMWAFLKDFTTVHYELETDKEMCELGEHYIKGGLEFYSKILLRNKALRALMGEKGEKLYSVKGNDQYFLRQKHLPPTLREEYFETRLKELEASSVQSPVQEAPSVQSPVQDTSVPAPA